MRKEELWRLERDELTAKVYRNGSPRDGRNVAHMAIFQDYNEQFMGDPPESRPDGCDTLNDLGAWLRQARKDGTVIAERSLYQSPGATQPYFTRYFYTQAPSVGAIYIMREQLPKLGWKRLTPKREEELRDLMTQEIEAYNNYLAGNVYSFEITQVTHMCTETVCSAFSLGTQREAERRAVYILRRRRTVIGRTTIE